MISISYAVVSNIVLCVYCWRVLRTPIIRLLTTTQEVKNTTEKPIQLATTPIAEYELMNMSGRNS